MREAEKKPRRKPDDSLESLPHIGKTTAGKLRRIGMTSKKECLKGDLTLDRCAPPEIVGSKNDVPTPRIPKATIRDDEKRHHGHI